MRSKLLILTEAFFIITFAAGLAGCTGETTPAPLTASEIIASSSEQMRLVNSFHFGLEQVGGGTPIAMGLEMTDAVGDVVRPNRLQTTISGKVAGMFLEVQLINVGEDIYMTNPLTKKWEALPAQFNVLEVFDVNTGIAAIMQGILQLERLEDEALDGVLCYHLGGNIISNDLRPITIIAVEGASIPIEIWIGQEDFLLRSIKLEGRITEAEVEGIVRTLKLSDYNAAVTIEPPNLNQ